MASNAEKVPLRARLKAWWEGYDEKDLEKKLKEKRKLSDLKEPEPEPEPEIDPDLPVDPWDEKRVNLAQYIWGEGYCGPGGSQHITSMSKLLSLSPEMSLMQLGAGIGGPGRTLAENFGVWVTGYEQSQSLTDAGNNLSKMKGMSNKVKIHKYNPEDGLELKRNFDRAFSKEATFTLPEKREVFNTIFQNLKSEGLFLLTDYVLINESASIKPAFKEWKEGEPETPYLCTPDETADLLTKAGFSVRVQEDISLKYIEHITQAWLGADKVIAELMSQDDGPQLIETLLKEAEFWTRRSKMLKSGDIQVWRFLGYKKNDPNQKMMSNW